MAKKQFRTVKKSSQTGRLNRASVRSVIISVRNERLHQSEDHAARNRTLGRVMRAGNSKLWNDVAA